MGDAREVLSRVSALLAGRPVEMRIEPPPYEGALGCVINDGGKCLVYVHSCLHGEEFLEVLLHELAHVKLHFSLTPPTTHARSGAWSIPRAAVKRLGDAIGRPVEDEADTLAHTWLKASFEYLHLFQYESRIGINYARLLSLEYTLRGEKNG